MNPVEVRSAITRYCELSPDIFANSHYREMLASSGDIFDTSISLRWIQNRLAQDKKGLINLDGSTGHTIDSWDLSWEN